MAVLDEPVLDPARQPGLRGSGYAFAAGAARLPKQLRLRRRNHAFAEEPRLRRVHPMTKIRTESGTNVATRRQQFRNGGLLPRDDHLVHIRGQKLGVRASFTEPHRPWRIPSSESAHRVITVKPKRQTWRRPAPANPESESGHRVITVKPKRQTRRRPAAAGNPEPAGRVWRHLVVICRR
jgi:hypothetical protein